ncbi:hypothetical protein J0X14_13505 [Muricauda sp. CAU 1633]|uniref:hypothetical protein n=1 Tax=Allomuricauda sp. CAU 1633 TaxID=2816036 RepID=UPI001A8E0D74|nr:hypothetical protein [Muricauda sp. CAU 1633]MBO0323319.1 hypothetical protein [Muricauda sp. CAU 1633]
MTLFLNKRIAIYVSLILTIGILTPSALKLHHALFGHTKEKRCVSHGAKHFHDADIHCEFHDFTLASNVFFGSSFIYTAVEVPQFGQPQTFFVYHFKSHKKEFKALRGPPQVS